MRFSRTVLIGLVVVGFTPGAAELLADGAHLLFDGHTAHAQEHAHGEHGEHGHDGPDPEHGCTGWLHTCACHTSLSVIPMIDGGLPRLAAGGVSMWPGLRDRGADGVSFGIERPPRV